MGAENDFDIFALVMGWKVLPFTGIVWRCDAEGSHTTWIDSDIYFLFFPLSTSKDLGYYI